MNSDIRAINELKILSLDIINRARSGSPGICLDMAPAMYTLFAKVLQVMPSNDHYLNRDRVVLSSAHLTPLYYAMLHIAGFPIKKEDLMNFKRCNSIVPGIPELHTTYGVEASTAFAGDGVGIAVGMALTRRYLSSLIFHEEEKLRLLTYNIFCFCSDADILNGSTYEAFEFAVSQKLDHLVFLYDYNNMGYDGEQTDLITDNLVRKFQNIGLYADVLKDATNMREIEKALVGAKNVGKPAILIFKNVIGADSFNAGKNILHEGPLSFDDLENIRKKFHSFLAPFEVSKDTLIHTQNQIMERMKKVYSKWNEQYTKARGYMSPIISQVIALLENNQTVIPFDSMNYKINDGYRESLLESNEKIMNLISPKSPLFLGGSAGLALETRAFLNGSGFQNTKNPLNKNIRFGPRERAMTNILNGMALSGLKVFGSTKLCFLGECLNGMRMSALMNLPVTYILTNDSLYDSLEGPARIPVEQLTMLRSIPNLTVYRPADINEIMGSWESILINNKPAALVITKNSIPKLPGSNGKEVSKGAYIIKPEQQKLDGIIIATGSEVVSAMQIAYDLVTTGLDIRVVSMTSVELFNAMGSVYENTLLPKNIKTIVLEAGCGLLWNRFATSEDYIISVNDFAYCGIPIEVLQKMSYDYDSLKLKVESLLR